MTDPTARAALFASIANVGSATAPRRRKVSLPPIPSFLSDDALLTVREVAAWRRGGVSTVWRDVKRGTLPAPVYVTPKSPRWRLRDLRAVLEGAA